MKTLAFITFIITAPAQHAGEMYITEDPMECVRDGDRMMYHFRAIGVKADMFCEYTTAPVTSLRPVARTRGGDQ